MLFLVTLDTGNMSDPPFAALVEADTPENAIAEARGAVSSGDSTPGDYEAATDG